MFYLKLLGSPTLETDAGAMTGRAVQRHRVGLLTLLALAPGRRMSRDKLLGYLWPDRDTENARNLLKVATYVLRAELGDTALLSDGDDLRLNDEIVQVDAVLFEAAVRRTEFARAVELYRGPLLDGFFISDAPEFEQWVQQQRTRLANDFAGALETLAIAAEGSGQIAQAIEWWRRRAAHDPHDTRVAIRLIEALDAGGSRGLALQHAAIHQHILREEFDIEPPVEMIRLVEQLRAQAVSAPELQTDVVTQDEDAIATSPGSAPVYPRIRRARTYYRLAAAAIVTILLAGAVYGVSALRSQTGTTARALAVMPFVNMTADGGGDYFSDGLTEQIISVLSRIPDLRVAARTSSFALRDKKLDIRAIADTLDVNVVLEGSVRREGSRLRVTAQLIDAATGYHIWSGDYDREMRQILEVQDEVAEDIAHALALRMPKRAAQSSNRRPPNLEAYDLYLRALYLRDTFTPEALRQARHFLDRATELDPNFALAYAHKATVIGPAIYWRHIPLEPGVSEARTAIKRALEIDPQLGDAYGALGMVELFFEWDLPAAERALRRAVELNPNDHHAWHQLANYHRAMGHPMEAVRARSQAVAIDPLNVRMGVMLAGDNAAAGRVDEAHAQYRRSMRLDPAHPLVLGLGPNAPAGPWVIYWKQGRNDLVLEEYSRIASMRGADARELEILNAAYQRGGMSAFWRSWLEFDLRHAGPNPDPVRVATFYALAGDQEHALEWLDRALAERNAALVYVYADPAFASMQKDARFRRILQQMNFPTAS